MFWLLLSFFGLFILFAMDIRGKKGMTPIVGKHYVIFMKLSCLVLLILYLDSLFKIKEIGIVEWSALLFTSLGTLIVAISKLRLSDSFSWTGHFLKDTKLITNGIYQYVRNPLYTGVFLFEIGAVVNFTFNSVLISDNSLALAILGGVTLFYAVAFNIVMAHKESAKLEEQFGQEYQEYKQRTGAFLPKISIFSGAQNNATS